MTLSDNPIAASYLYLLEPEIRFLEAAVEHLIPTDELGPGARDAGVVVYIDRALAGTWGVHVNIVAAHGGHAAAGLSIVLHAARGLSHRDPRDRSALQSRVRPAFRAACE